MSGKVMDARRRKGSTVEVSFTGQLVRAPRAGLAQISVKAVVDGEERIVWIVVPEETVTVLKP